MVLNKLAGHPDSYRRRKEYKMGETIGEGTFGIVRQAEWTTHNPPKRVAIKVIAKRLLKDNVDVVEQELQVLKQCDHPNIIKLFDDFESKDKFYMVMEQATGGDVFDRMIRRGTLPEAHAARVIRSITSAVAYLHDHNIAHRDIKPENILYRTKAENSEVVLVDFGVAQALSSKGELMSSLAGSYGYVAPEVLTDEHGYGKEVDMWSVGVVTYVMISGYTPFRGSGPKELREEILRHAAAFDEKYWGMASPDARDFVLSCLTIDWTKRLTARQALNHPWLTTEHTNQANLIAGLRENYGRDKLQRPPLPRRTTRLVHVERRGRDRHELESSDEDDEEEEAEGANAATPVAPAPSSLTSVSAARKHASITPTLASSAGKPSTATSSRAPTPSVGEISTAPTSTAPSIDMSRVTTGTEAKTASAAEAKRSSLVLTGANASTNTNTNTTTGATTGTNTGTTAGTNAGPNAGTNAEPSGASSPSGILGGLVGLVTGDKKERRSFSLQRADSSSGGRRKSRFSFLRLSRSTSGRTSSQSGIRPVLSNDVHSSSQLDENTFDDEDEDEPRPLPNGSSTPASIPEGKPAPPTVSSPPTPSTPATGSSSPTSSPRPALGGRSSSVRVPTTLSSVGAPAVPPVAEHGPPPEVPASS